jgi:dynein heavy chain
VYNKTYNLEWKELYEKFRLNINHIEEKTIKLINDTFKDKLSSSESAFDLLIRFKSVDTRKEIKDTLERKYKNVLERYNQELDEIKELYVKYRDNPPIPKNMPPRAGSIMWVRSLITRIKTPIDKFITLPEILIKEKVG